MTKVPHNKGSYRKRPGREAYQVKIPLGWNESKKKYDEYFEETSSEAEAIALIKDVNDFLYHGGDAAGIVLHRRKKEIEDTGNAITLKEFAEEFCATREGQRNRSTRTLKSDRECLARIMPYLGTLPLKGIKPQDIDKAYAQMRSTKNRNLSGRPYSGTTLQKTHATLSMVFDKAIDYGYRDDNPCAKVDKPKRDTKEKMALTVDEAQALFIYITKKELAAKPIGVLISLLCGLRLSEMLALTWKDYSDSAFHVRKSLQKDMQATKSTKNGEERIVPCPPPMIPVMRRWKSEQKAWFEQNDLIWTEDTPIVANRAGGYVLQRTFGKWFSLERKKYPIPDNFDFHGLRHTYVTVMSRDCGIDARTTREMSGHKSDQAFQIYTHTNSEWKREAAERYGALLAPDADSETCKNCKHWSPSPADATLGACWSLGPEDILVTDMHDECCRGSFSAAMPV